MRRSTRLLGRYGLNRAQLNWHLDAAKKNLPAFVLIQDDKRNTYFVHSSHAEYLNELTAEQIKAISCANSLSCVFDVIEDWNR